MKHNEELWDINLAGDYTGPSDGDEQGLDYLGVSSTTKTRKLGGLTRLKAAHNFAKLNGTIKKVSSGEFTGP